MDEEERRELEQREMLKLGEDLEASCVSVEGSLKLLLRGLRDFDEWRNVITANHVLPTNVLQQVAIIASQVSSPLSAAPWLGFETPSCFVLSASTAWGARRSFAGRRW